VGRKKEFPVLEKVTITDIGSFAVTGVNGVKLFAQPDTNWFALLCITITAPADRLETTFKPLVVKPPIKPDEEFQDDAHKLYLRPIEVARYSFILSWLHS